MNDQNQPDFTDNEFVAVQIKDFKEIQDTYLNSLVVTDDTVGGASDQLRALKLTVKNLEEERLNMTRPIEEAKKNIIRRANEIIDPIKKEILILSDKILKYQMKKDEEEKERQRLAQEQERLLLLEKQKELEEQAVINQSELAIKDAIVVEEKIEAIDKEEIVGKTRSRGTFSNTSMVPYWEVEVIDFAKLPDEWKLPNEKALKGAVNRKDGLRNIPGCKIHEKKRLRTSGRY